MAAPKQTEISIQYSIGVKGQFPHNQYENATASMSRSEKWDVTGLTQDEIDDHFSTRFAQVEKELGDIMAGKYRSITTEGEI